LSQTFGITMKTMHGDPIKLAQQGEFDVIAHGCNCQCQMGAGIAKTIKAVFPAAYEADCRTRKGSRDKLGTCSFAECETATGTVVVVNAYTQFHWRGRGVKADYGAIRSCMAWIGENFSGMRIGLPKIGAGLAGGDWGVISRIISEELAGEDVTIVEYRR
jgi:O-acetyl-ADP-ribose deacetylase (regulator of RNase III)